MKRSAWITGVVLAVLAVCTLSLTMDWPQRLVSSFAYAVESGQAEAAKTTLRQNTNWQTAFELAAKAIEPSVVTITSSRTVHQGNTGMQLPPQFRRFFGNESPFFGFFDNLPHNLHQEGLGSGVIVSADGYILTNNHVVNGADQLTVQLSDNREFKAKVIGTDPKTDVAVIKIDAHDLTPATLALDSPVEVGQWVLAAGNPFGLRETVTAGIISATGRANVGIADYEDFVQTDAAINPGNSGGPLVDLEGRVVGINTAIATHNGGYQGVGFAIPIDMAHNVMEQLITNGKVTRAYLGVVIQPLSPELARSFRYTREHGILVADVMRDSPASKAGLKDGDILMSMNGQELTDISSFRNQVAETAPGAKIKLEAWRDGKTQEFTVALEQMPASFGVVASGRMPIESLGLTLGNLTPALAREHNLAPNATGALVLSVTPGSTAEMAGLQPGDLIVEVQGTAVHSADQAQGLLSGASLKEGVRLRVQHAGTTRYVFLQVQG